MRSFLTIRLAKKIVSSHVKKYREESGLLILSTVVEINTAILAHCKILYTI